MRFVLPGCGRLGLLPMRGIPSGIWRRLLFVRGMLRCAARLVRPALLPRSPLAGGLLRAGVVRGGLRSGVDFSGLFFLFPIGGFMRNRVIYRSRAVEGWSAALVAGARSAVRPALRDALLELGCSPGYAAAARPSRDEFAAAARRVRSGV